MSAKIIQFPQALQNGAVPPSLGQGETPLIDQPADSLRKLLLGSMRRSPDAHHAHSLALVRREFPWLSDAAAKRYATSLARLRALLDEAVPR